MRHILNKHQGQGEPLDIMDYMLKVQAGIVSYPSYRRPSGLPASQLGRNPQFSDSLVQHSIEKIKDVAPKLDELKHKGESVGLKVDVCSDCLTHKMFSYSKDNFTLDAVHGCDMNWILDNPIGPDKKDVALALLREKIPEYMTRLVEQLAGPPLRLVIRQDYSNLQEQVDEVVKRLATDRLKKSTRDAPNDFLIQGLELQLKAARSGDNKNNIQFNHLDLDSTTNYGWLKRACLEGMYEPNKEELTQFFSFAHSTIATVGFKGRKYWVFLPLQN
jgi:hypothetical protein